MARQFGLPPDQAKSARIAHSFSKTAVGCGMPRKANNNKAFRYARGAAGSCGYCYVASHESYANHLKGLRLTNAPNTRCRP